MECPSEETVGCHGARGLRGHFAKRGPPLGSGRGISCRAEHSPRYRASSNLAIELVLDHLCTPYLLVSLSTSGSSARLRLSGDLRHSSDGPEYLLHSLATLANMLRLLTRAYLAALLSSLGSASIYPTNPIASTVLGAGRVNTIQWIDDGKWPTLDAMGPVKIDLYVGEVSTLFLRQLLLLARPPVPRKRVVSKV